MSRLPFAAFATLAASALLLSISSLGCGPSVDPEVAALRSRLLLAEPPAGAMTVEKARASVLDQPGDVSVSAWVTSGEFAFWDPDAAMFAVWDVMEDGHGGEGHDPSTCPFCKRRIAELKNRRAMVKMVDDDGRVVPMPAQKLLGISENQRLVVQGRGELDKAGNLVVSADGVYLPE